MRQPESMSNNNTIGVLGAGAMGSGIALVALLADLRVILYDVETQFLEKARDYIESHLQRKQRAINIKYLALSSELEAFRAAKVVIEAVPEELRLKQEVFARLDEICPPPTILATNTSTLSVTVIAGVVATPERVAGMHFFNPAPVLPLVEVIRGARSSLETIQALVDLARKMGKTPVVAGDTPGFIVNRVARPFYGEALRLLGEGVATHEQIDRVVRMGAGFRMGPFELMDLIGIDVNFAATQSMFEQTFSEPRYRPHIIQARMVQQNALGRKTAQGFYTYDPKTQPGKETGVQPAPRSGQGLVLISEGTWAAGFEDLSRESGYQVKSLMDGGEGDIFGERVPAAGVVVAGREEGLVSSTILLDRIMKPHLPLFVQCADATLTEIATSIEHPERLVGFDGLFLSSGSIATLVAGPGLQQEVRQAGDEFVKTLGRLPVWVEDSPGLILPRIACMLANEAAFAAGEGVAEQDTIDMAMQLGANYPWGPMAWARELGYGRVVSVLDHLKAEFGEERYRVAPLLRRWARSE